MYYKKRNEIKEENKKKILCVFQLPPPIHGASMMNSFISKSLVINHEFNLKYIDLHFVDDLKEISKFSLKKLCLSIKYFIIISYVVLTFKPDLVYFSLALNGFAFFRDVSYVTMIKGLRKKILFHLHGKGINENILKFKLNKKIYRYVFKNTYVICLSKKLQNDLTGVYDGKPFIIPNGIPDYNNSGGLLIRKKKTDPVILFLSNYKVSKGVITFINALEILNKKGYAFRGVLVGADSDLSQKDISDILTTKSLRKIVEVKGPFYGDDKYLEYKNADIFVFPTYYKNETFGLVNLEAMQFGLPVISTNIGGIPDVVINDKTGFIINPRDSEMLAKKIEVLLLNEKLRVKMGSEGRKRFINYYTLNKFEKNLVKTFNKVLLS